MTTSKKQDYASAYYIKHKEKILARVKDHRNKNKQSIAANKKRYNQAGKPGYRWYRLVSNCLEKFRKVNGKDLLNITKGEFLDWALQEENKNCFYCDSTNLGAGSGVDRIDSFKAYELGNIVTCCKYCNNAKNDMTLTAFKDHIEKIYENLKRKAS